MEPIWCPPPPPPKKKKKNKKITLRRFQVEGLSSRRGFLRLSRVLPTSRVFTSGYVNMETILHFFIWMQNASNLICSHNFANKEALDC